MRRCHHPPTLLTTWQYTDGAKDPELVSPDGAAHDQFLLDREGDDEIQLDLFLSYGGNPPLYPKWRAYFREHQPPMLIAWGKNDKIFPPAGAEPYKRDLKTLDFHLIDAGHFALETDGDAIATRMRTFLDEHVSRKRRRGGRGAPSPAEGARPWPRSSGPRAVGMPVDVGRSMFRRRDRASGTGFAGD